MQSEFDVTIELTAADVKAYYQFATARLSRKTRLSRRIFFLVGGGAILWNWPDRE